MLAIGRSLISRPKLLLLDEPFAELPVDHARELLRIIMDERMHEGLATLLVSHVWPESWKTGLRVEHLVGEDFFHHQGNLPVSGVPL